MRTCTTIIFSLFCFTLASRELKNNPSLSDTILSFSDAEFNELEQKLESEDPTFRFKFIFENDVSLFLAAQEKRPQSFIWVDLVVMYYAGEGNNARKLNDENERKKLFENSLQYLMKSKETLQSVQITENNKAEYYSRIKQLNEMIAGASIETGELERAKQMANELLENNTDTLSFNYGSIICNGNTILGRVALKEGDLEHAKEYLIKSAETPGSPELNSFGPSFILAKELLQEGEKEIVLNYLDLIARFWAKPGQRSSSGKIEMLEKWKEEINAGKIPNDPKWK